MLMIAAGIFAVTALGGAVLAYLHFSGKAIPMALALIHGAAGGAGLAALGWAVLALGMGGGATVALGLFVVAALGGFFLFSFQIRQERLPSFVVGVHALVAVAAFLTLVITVAKG